MIQSLPIKDLQPGDVLLYYTPGSVVDWLIGFRTWSDVAHVEVYRGNQTAFASRNGVGVNVYPFRAEGLRYVLRPRRPFHLQPAIEYANFMRGTRYGFFELLAFYLFPNWIIRLLEKCFGGRGIVCSPYANYIETHGGVECFAWHYPENRIAPSYYLISPAFKMVWSYKHGTYENIAADHSHATLGQCDCA
jgi:hypothetical protein